MHFNAPLPRKPHYFRPETQILTWFSWHRRMPIVHIVLWLTSISWSCAHSVYQQVLLISDTFNKYLMLTVFYLCANLQELEDFHSWHLAHDHQSVTCTVWLVSVVHCCCCVTVHSSSLCHSLSLCSLLFADNILLEASWSSCDVQEDNSSSQTWQEIWACNFFTTVLV